MKKSRTVLIIVLAVVVLAGAWLGTRGIRVAARRARDLASSYSTALVTRDDLEVRITGTGTLAPQARQDCIVSAGGEVEKVNVQPGQEVKAGDVLAVLSNDSLSDQVKQARMDLNLAQLDLDALTKPGAAAATAADVAAAKAAVESARLAVERAQDDVDDLTVKAPFAGRVSGLSVEAGDEVAAGTSLLSVSTPDQLEASLSVPENDLKYLAIGDAITVTVRPLSRDLKGHVTAIAAQSSVDSRGSVTYPITVTLDDSDERVRGGMSVSAVIDTNDSWPFGNDTVYGTLAYSRIEPVVTATGGTVRSVAVSEDEMVSEGQILLTLENDQVQAALVSAQADLDQAEERLAQLTDPTPSSYPESQITKAQVRVDQSALQLAGLERQLDELTVTAGFDGVVADVSISAGDRVAPNGRVAVVADLDQVQAVITIDELEVAALAVGQEAEVRIDALPGETFTGTVESLSLEGVVSDGVTSYEARISLPGDSRMRSGMSLSASVEVALHENALIVPVEAVYGAGQEASVQLLVDGRPEAHDVVAGLSNDTYTEILSGLEEGQTVITGSIEVDNNPFGMGGGVGGGSNSGGNSGGGGK